MSSSMTGSGIVTHPPSFLQRWIVRPVKYILDGIWHILAFIVGAVIIGGIVVNVVISLITSGTPGLTDPRTWVVTRPLLAHPLYGAFGLSVLLALSLGAYLGHRASHSPRAFDGLETLQETYGLAPVVSAEPSNALIPSYRPDIYIHRRTADSHVDADDLARKALLDAVTRRDPMSNEGKYGICVYGRKLLGTSRLAWEAMKHDVQHNRDFSKWTLVKWPSEPKRHSDLITALATNHARVVVWLENLDDLATTDRRALISSLPLDLAESDIPFVVIATCEEGYGEKLANKNFGDLMQHLTPIRLADISRDEANNLVHQLGRAGDQVHRDDQYDGTPGSIVLAVTSLREEVYPRLPDLSKRALRAIKLLRSAGVRDYPIKRVRAAVRDVFNVSGSDHEWEQALRALTDAGFTTIQVVASTVQMTNEVYLDLAVPEYSGSHSHVADEWPLLRQSFEREEDWRALARLGDAFRRRGDNQQAELSYLSALGGLTKESSADDWALAQFGLGSVLIVKIESLAEDQQSPLLDQAKGAFNAALSVVTPGSDPTIWAEASNGLATVYRAEASNGLDDLLRQGRPSTREQTKRNRILDSALAESRDALKVLKKDSAPEDWAEAKHQLGLVLYTAAQLSWEARERRAKLDAAIDHQRHALTVFTEDAEPVNLARVERAMGDACKLRADASIRPRKDEMLKQAISSYAHAIGIATARHLWSGDELAMLHSHLGYCFRSLALLNEPPQRSKLLESATEAFRAAAHGFDPQSSQIQKAEALRDLGIVIGDLALVAEPEKKAELLNEGLVAFADAFRLLGHRGTNLLHAQLHLGLAGIHWQRVIDVAPPIPSDVVQTFGNAQRSLRTFTQSQNSAEFSHARRLVRDAERKARELNIQLPADGNGSSARNRRAAS